MWWSKAECQPGIKSLAGINLYHALKMPQLFSLTPRTHPWRSALLALCCCTAANAWAKGLNPDTDTSQSPAADARWLTLIFEAQEGLEPGPVTLEYEARKCMENRSYGVGGQSQSGTTKMKALDFEKPTLQRQPDSHNYQTRFALDAGGPCQWQLRAIETSFVYRSSLAQFRGQQLQSTWLKINFSDSKEAVRAPDTRITLDYFPVIFVEEKPAESELKLRAKTMFLPPDFDPSASGSLRLRIRMHEDKALTVSRDPKQRSSYLLHYPDGSTLTTNYRSGAGVDDARMRCLLSQRKQRCEQMPDDDD